MRESKDIVDARKIIMRYDTNSIISVTLCTFSHPEYLYQINNNTIEKYILDGNYNKRYQEFIPTYFRNGSIYITTIKYLKNKNFVIDHKSPSYNIMPFIRSINIDNEEDWNLAEILYKIK